MVKLENVEKGLASYLDTELMPKLPEAGLQKVLAGAAVSILIKRGFNQVEVIKTNPIIQMMEIIDNENNVDIDTIRDEIKAQIGNSGISVDVPIIGTMVFKKEDVDSLYQHIMKMDNAATNGTMTGYNNTSTGSFGVH